jgi:Domain of unknown function DUF29
MPAPGIFAGGRRGMKPHRLYHQDFYAWALRSAKLLRQGKFKEIDVEHIAEEIESMGKSDKRELMSRFIVLMAHLLKWQFQPERRGNSWRRTIVTQRTKIPLVLVDSPSLNHELAETLGKAYEAAVSDAAAETQLSKDTFPDQCPYSLEQCLDQEFFPE